MKYGQFFKSIIAIALLLSLAAAPAFSETNLTPQEQQLIDAYPELLAGIQDGELIWRDGTRMPMSDGRENAKSAQDKLDDPSISDMLETPYPTGPAKAPSEGSDRVGHGMLASSTKCMVTARRATLLNNSPQSLGCQPKRTSAYASQRSMASTRSWPPFPTSLKSFQPSSTASCFRPPAPTYAARSPEPIAGQRTATASRSTSPQSTQIIGAGHRRLPPRKAVGATRSQSRSSKSSKNMASSGVAAGITSTPCILSIVRNY